MRTRLLMRMPLALTAALLLVLSSVGVASATNTGIPPQLVPYEMQAVAGNNQLPYNAEVAGYGGDGQLGPAATLSSPGELAVDAAGNVYFVDAGNALIREVNAQSGIITTVAGQAPSACVGTVCTKLNTGCSDGIAAAGNPIGSSMHGIAVDAYGNVFFSDAATDSISVVYRGGTRVAAFIKLEDPNGVALSNGVQAGFVYHIAGTVNLTTCVGTATAAATSNSAAVPAGDGNLAFNSGATFSTVGPLSLDSAGNLYIGDAGINGVIRVINTQPQAQTFFSVTVQPGYIASIVNCGSLTQPCPTMSTPETLANTGVGAPAGGGSLTNLANGQGAYMSTDGYGNIYELNTKLGYPAINLAVAYAGGTALANLIANANAGASSSIAGTAGLKAVAGDFYYLLNSITLRPSSVTADPVGNVYYQDNHYGQIYRIDANAFPFATDFLEVSYLTSAGLTTETNRTSVASNTAPGFCYPLSGQSVANPVLTGYQTRDQFGNGCPVIYAEGIGVPRNGTGYGTTLADGPGNLYIADQTNDQIRKITLDTIFPVTPVGQQWNPTTFAGEQSVQVHFDGSNLPVLATQSPSVTTTAFAIASGIPDFAINPVEAQWTTATNSGLVVGPTTFTYTGTQTGAEVPVCTNVTGANDKSLDCVVNIIFSPTQPGLRQGQLVATTANGSTYTFALSGIGSGPQLAIDGGAQAVVPTTGVGNVGQIAVTQSGAMYIADPANNRIVVQPVGGGTQTTIGAGLKSPLGVAVDGSGNVYIADTGNNRIVEVSQATGAQTVIGNILVAGTPAYSNYAFKSPEGLAVDLRGNVYVADTGNAKVVEIPSDPKLGGATPLLQYPGAPTLAKPVAVALDNKGNIYVADTGNIQVLEIPAGGGDLQTLPGALAGFGSILSAPSGVAVDAAGDIYVSDSGANLVYELPSASGLAAATLPINFTGLNLTAVSPAVASFSGGSLALDANGNLYLADSGNGRVLFANRLNPTVPCGLVAQDQPAAACGATPVNAGAANLIVTNIGNLAANLTSPFTTVTSSNTAFKLTNTCSGTLPVGGYCTISPTFLPTSDGAASETFTVNGSSAQTVTLTGNGEQPLVKIVLSNTPTTGSAVAGQPVTVTATLTQPNISGDTPTGTVNFSYTVNGGTAVAVPVTLSGSAGTSTASFTIANSSVIQGEPIVVNATYQGDALDSPTVALPLSILPTGPLATTTTLAITSAGTPVTTVASPAVVTLTATVAVGATPITTGQVNFCDATATYCTDIHLLGTAQLTSAGTAVMKLVPGIGGHSYKAVFVGTTIDVPSSSSLLPLSVTGTAQHTVLTTSGVAGNYNLTATVTGITKAIAPTGTVSFLDTNNANFSLGTVSLGTATEAVSFAARPTLTTTAKGAYSVVTGDFNGDGVPDLAVSNGGSPSLGIYLGNGDGTFTVTAITPIVPVGTFAGQVVVGDFNGDGNADLAVGNTTGQVTILLGNGDGTFTALASLSTGSSGTSIVTADFNGDGIADLAISNNAGFLAILLGRGDGTFTAAPTSPIVNSNTTQVITSDFNGDGKPDLAAFTGSYGPIVILLGNGDGTFTPVASPIAGSLPPDSLLAYGVAGDFNHDGIADIAVANDGARALVILLGNGDGTFRVGTSSPVIGLYPFSIAVGDINGDGKADIAVEDQHTSSVTILLGNGDGTFGTSPAVAVSEQPAMIALADINGDGNSDLLVSIGGYQSVQVFVSSLTETASASDTGIAIAGSGTHQIEASYSGDGNYSQGSSATVGLTAQPLVTSLSLQPNPVAGSYGQQVTLTATLSPYSAQRQGTNAETVTFLSNSIPIGTATLSSGVASLSVTSLNTGSDKLTATYAGDTNFALATSNSVSYTVAKDNPTIIWAPPNGSIYTGQAIGSALLNATSTTGGTFSYSIANSHGVLSPLTSSAILAAGSYTLTAQLTPTDQVNNSVASITAPYTVTLAPLTLVPVNVTRPFNTANPALTATVTGALNTDTFTVTGASTATAASPVGSYPITYTVAGSNLANYSVGAQTGTLTITAVTPSITWPTPSAIVYGAALSSAQLNATASTPGAFVYTPAAGTALPAGRQTLSASFTPTDTTDYLPAAATNTIAVTPATPSITWPQPSAIVYGTALSAAQLNATASTPGAFTYTPALGSVPAAGAQTLAVRFIPSDTTDYASATGTVSLLTNKAPLAIAANNAARVFGTANPTFTGTVTGAVNGDTFAESFSTAASPASTVGSYPIVPSVAGANLADYAVTPANGALTISQAGTSTTFALSNSNLTLTATVASLTSGTPTGSVSFYEGQTLVGTGTLSNGTATYTATSLAAGDVTISAQYSGDANFTLSTSSAISLLAVSPASTALTVSGSGSVSDILNLSVAPGYIGTVQFSCSGLPAATTCSFQPTSATFTGTSNTASITVTIQTGVVASATPPALLPRHSRMFALAATLLWIPCFLFAPHRRLRASLLSRRLTLLLLLACACFAATSCGSAPSAPSSSSTSAGTSTIQIVANGPASLSQSTGITLTVQ
jgi:sugar lactone lactonase YvrE